MGKKNSSRRQAASAFFTSYMGYGLDVGAVRSCHKMRGKEDGI
jgi:hypothetical protein